MVKYVVSYLFAALLGVFMLPYWSMAQNGDRITIERTDSLRSFVSDGVRVNRLFGMVKLRDRERVFESDSAYHFPDLDRIQAWGNLRITGSNETIWADTLEYTADVDSGTLRGRVVIEQDSLTLYSSQAVYDFKNEIARFPTMLELHDQKSMLLALSGIYYNQSDSAVFVGDVQLADSTSYIEGDTLRYKRDAGRYWLSGDVFGENSTDSIRFRGSALYGDSSGYKRIAGGAIIEKWIGSKPDTTFIGSKVLEYFRTGSSYRVDAFGEATVVNAAYAARADSIAYIDSLSVVSIRGNTRIWQDRIQLSSSRQEIYLNGSNVDSLLAFSRPFAVLEDSLTGRLHQLTGSMITVRFDSSNVRQIQVPSQTQLVYFPLNERDEPDGALQIRIGAITLFFADGEIDEIFGLEAPEGEVFEEVAGVDQLRLQGFQYEPELRPSRPLQRPEPRLIKPVRDRSPFLRPDLPMKGKSSTR